MPIQPADQDATAVDSLTVAAIERAQEQARRGEVVTLQQAEANLKKHVQAWQKIQAAQLPA